MDVLLFVSSVFLIPVFNETNCSECSRVACVSPAPENFPNLFRKFPKVPLETLTCRSYPRSHYHTGTFRLSG